MQTRVGLPQSRDELQRDEQDEQKAWNHVQAGQFRPPGEVQIETGERRETAGGYASKCDQATDGGACADRAQRGEQSPEAAIVCSCVKCG